MTFYEKKFFFFAVSISISSFRTFVCRGAAVVSRRSTLISVQVLIVVRSLLLLLLQFFVKCMWLQIAYLFRMNERECFFSGLHIINYVSSLWHGTQQTNIHTLSLEYLLHCVASMLWLSQPVSQAGNDSVSAQLCTGR